MKVHSAVLALSFVTSAITASAALAADSIGVNVQAYPAHKASAYVLAHIIKNDLGREVSFAVTTNLPVVYKALGSGDGEIDVNADAWYPNQKPLLDEYVQTQGTVEKGEHSYEPAQGVCVPKYAADAHDIKELKDLANPDIARLFDINGDGKGDMWGGGPGWMSSNTYKVKARDYGYLDLFELSNIEEGLMFGQLKQALAEKKPFAFYCYAPNWYFSAYELVILEEPPYGAECFNMVQPGEDAGWWEKSRVTCHEPPAEAYVLFSKSLRERAPDVANFLKNVEFDSDTVSGWVYSLIVDEKDPEVLAREWVEANRKRVDGWLGLN